MLNNKPHNKRQTNDKYDAIWSVLNLLLLIVYFVGLEKEMPYDKWLLFHIPPIVALINTIIICGLFLYFAIPRELRSSRISFLVGSIVVILAIVSKPSTPRSALITIAVLISAIIFIAIKIYFHDKKIIESK
jgi:FtsH-binding integral membrane protein